MNTMSIKSVITTVLLLSLPLAQCSKGADQQNNAKQLTSIAENLPKTIISFYPSIDQYSSYNYLTNSYPNCSLEGCGKPITFITNQDNVLTINTTGTSYPSYSLSPSKKALLIQDNYGAHVITKDKYAVNRNDPDFYHDRGGAALDDGRAVAMSHLGAIEVDGKSGFGSHIAGFSNSNITQYRQIIDGTLIQCGEGIFLFSYGDEDKDNPVAHSYQFDWTSNRFIDLQLPSQDQNTTIHMHRCINDNSFEYIRTTFDGHIHGIWNSKDGFSDIKPINIEDIRIPNGIQNYSFEDNGIYYIDDESRLFFADFSTGENKLLYLMKNQTPDIDMSKHWSTAILENKIIIIGRSAHHNNKYAGIIFNIDSQTVEKNKFIPQLDRVYGSDDIDDIRVSDINAVSAWFATMPDNNP